MAARKKTILLLHTGGTLAMAAQRPGGPLRPSNVERLLRDGVPELWRIADIRLEIFSNIDSSDMHPSIWSPLAQRIDAALERVDGVVVIHGTDTMAWTASALSFMLQGLNKPVVLSGSQRPLGAIRNDARLNLIDAVTAAEAGPPEVGICFGSRLLRGNRTTKIRINDYDAFDSPNFPALGTLGVDVVWNDARSSRSRRRAARRLEPRLESRVLLLKLFPGIDPSFARALLPGLRGLVVEGFGSGNFPIQGAASLLPLFDAAREQGLPVLMISQARYDGIDLSLYEAGAEAARRGVIGGGDMTAEAAVAKMMHVLASTRSPARVRALLEADLAGERSV